MVNLPRLKMNKIFACVNGLLMPDGNEWCSITMLPCHGCSDSYKPGNVKLYKPIPKGVVPQQKIQKVKLKEVKPKALPKIKRGKTLPGQTRLF